MILVDNYYDSYFDAYYINQRKTKFENFLNKGDDNQYGIYTTLTLNFDQLFKVDFSYRQVLDSKIVGNRPNNKFSLQIFVYPALLGYAYIVFTYDRLGINNFGDFFSDFFSDNYTAIDASLRLPFKFPYMEFQVNFKRTLTFTESEAKAENIYETQVKFKF